MAPEHQADSSSKCSLSSSGTRVDIGNSNGILRMTMRGAAAFFNPFPKYLQIRQALQRRMVAEYELGQQIPTEQALCEEFGVSRETVREALRGLEEDGIVERRRPKGTFLVKRPAHPGPDKLTGLAEDFTALKLDTYARVLSAGPLKGSDAFRISRLRYFEGQPLVVHETDLPGAIGRQVAGMDLEHNPITALLGGEGIEYVEERHQVEAMVADTALALLLEIPFGAPVLLVTRHMRLRGGAPAVFRSWYRADRYQYTVDFTARPKRPSTS